ncbi:MAG: putative sugar nucleotidyl transferase [candidate division KSB1 bacterium]|nr:putative sugar nucleotidyl transferase [candidate division KSB1 bacterium]MDZ7358025.1 putative sugar nucleotidyl transferase [candidate division KSB1 bacterium]
MKVIIFEDDQFDNLYPLTYLRPVYELKCGHTKLVQKIQRLLGDQDYYYFMREYLAPVFSKKYGADRVNQFNALNGDLLLVNGRLLAIDIALQVEGPEEVAQSEGQIIYARLKASTVQQIGANNVGELLKRAADRLPNKNIDAKLICFPWNLIQHNSKAIADDFQHIEYRGIHGELSPQAAIVGDPNLIHIASGASVRPFVTLDTSHGPIILDQDVIVHPYTHIEGPNAIGAQTQVFGGNIREGCAIGPVCRVRGEIEESIIHGYSNKHHDGFLGHAYVCEWVNLGAFTTNSDLKNDYTSVQIYIKGELVDSRDLKVGSFIGDHTKTSIGTLFTTGAVVGIMSNVVNAGALIPKFVPSFCWFINNRATKGFGFQHMVDTAAKAMARRKVQLTPEDEALLRTVFEMTKEERSYWIKKGFQSQS